LRSNPGRSAATLSAAFGRPISYRSVDGADAEAWISRLPVPGEYVPFIAMAAREVAGGHFDHVTDHAERLTGVKPTPADQVWIDTLARNRRAAET
jgi:uncharacterized protein YbjT (DUF2867 family)